MPTKKKILSFSSAMTDIRKEEIRGSIKQLMRVRGLRAISLSNYSKYKGIEKPSLEVHSLKLNLMDGYLYMHAYRKNDPLRSGDIIDDLPIDKYEKMYATVQNILKEEQFIPSKDRRNILVRICR